MLIRDPKGNPIALVGSARDITAQKQADEVLRESETRYRELFNGINSGVAVYEAIADGEDFLIRDFGQAAERIEEITKEEILGRKVTEVFPGVREMGLLDVLRRVWRTGTPEHHPISVYRDDRIAGWRENYVYKLPSGEIVALYEDVTEQRQAQEALRESEQRFRQVLEVSSDVIYWLNLESNTYEYVSPSVLPLSGFTPEEFAAWGSGASVVGFILMTGPSTSKNWMSCLARAVSFGSVSVGVPLATQGRRVPLVQRKPRPRPRRGWPAAGDGRHHP